MESQTSADSNVCDEPSPSKNSVPAKDSGSANHGTISVSATDHMNEAPFPVSAKLVRELDKSEIHIGSPSKVSIQYTFPCAPEAKGNGRYKILVHYGSQKIEQDVVIPRPRWLINEPAPYKVISTESVQPLRLAIDKQRRIYFTGNDNMYSFMSLSGEGSMKPTSVKCEGVTSVCGIAVDISEEETIIVYIIGNHKLKKYVDHVLVKEIGSLGSEKNQFNCPKGVCYHKDRVYVCDDNKCVQIFSPDLSGHDTEIIRVEDCCKDLDIDDSDNIFVMCVRSVFVYNRRGNRIKTFPLNGPCECPVSMRIIKDATNSFLYVTSSCIEVYTMEGKFVRRIGIWSGNRGRTGSLRMLIEGDSTPTISFVPDTPEKTKPAGLAVDCNGLIYVACYGGNEIQILSDPKHAAMN